jgi:23S rRNA (adenine2030-N6)-methyltransferase
VLIDSSFDRAREFARIANALAIAHKRWETGTYAIWYPLMGAGVIRGFERDIAATGIRKILQFEFSILPEDAATIPGCGMIIVNPRGNSTPKRAPCCAGCGRCSPSTAQAAVKVEWLARE